MPVRTDTPRRRYGIYNLEDVFELCVRQLGRDNVILVAPIEEILAQRRRAAETGLPVFSPNLSPEENRRKNREKLAEFERRWAFIRANGGADYDGGRCNAETVMAILEVRMASMRACVCRMCRA